MLSFRGIPNSKELPKLQRKDLKGVPLRKK